MRLLTTEIALHETTLAHLACREQRLMRLGMILWWCRLAILAILAATSL